MTADLVVAAARGVERSSSRLWRGWINGDPPSHLPRSTEEWFELGEPEVSSPGSHSTCNCLGSDAMAARSHGEQIPPKLLADFQWSTEGPAQRRQSVAMVLGCHRTIQACGVIVTQAQPGSGLQQYW